MTSRRRRRGGTPGGGGPRALRPGFRPGHQPHRAPALEAVPTAARGPAPGEAAFQAALAHQQAKRIPEAIRNYEASLAEAPDRLDALANLASCLRQADRLDESRRRYRQLLDRPGAPAAAFFNYANLLERMGDAEAAVKAHDRALELEPGLVEAFFNRARCRRELGDVEGAERDFGAFLAARPEVDKARVQLAEMLYRAKRTDEALRVCEEALARTPEDVAWLQRTARWLVERRSDTRGEEAARLFAKLAQLEPDVPDHGNALGVALQGAGRVEAALEAFRRVLRRFPDHAATLNNMGVLYRILHRPHDGVPMLRKALAATPGGVLEHVNLAFSLLDLGQVEEAERLGRRALELDPESVDARLVMGFCHTHSGRLKQAVDVYLEGLALSPGAPPAISNTLFVSTYLDDLPPSELTARHRTLSARIAPAVPPYRAWSGSPDPERRLKVAILSPDLRSHPVAFFLEPILEHYDRSQWEVVCYSRVGAPDATTARLRSRVDGWVDCAGWPHDRLARHLHAAAVDVVFETTGHTAGNLLPVLRARPAPLQALYIGYPCTSGLPEVDLVVSDAVVSPPGSESLYQESVLRMPGSFWCFRPPENGPPVGELPARRNGFVTFGSYNNLPKLTPTTLRLWAGALDAVPDSRLRLKSLAFADPARREAIRERFRELGIDPARILVDEPSMAFENFLATYQSLDIALDPSPFNGGTTTCQSLWMGVPVVTMAGEHFMSRMGASLLRNVGLDSLVTRDPEAFATAARNLAGDLDALEALRRDLRSRFEASPICDGPRAARELQAGIRERWRTVSAARQAGMDLPCGTPPA